MGSNPMFPKQIKNNPYLSVLSKINIATAQKSLFFDTKLSKRSKELLKLLKKNAFLKNYVHIGQGFYRVFLLFTRHYKSKRQKKLYLKKNLYLKLSLETLKLLNINAPGSHYILETQRGVMGHKSAINLGQGGSLVCLIF